MAVRIAAFLAVCTALLAAVLSELAPELLDGPGVPSERGACADRDLAEACVPSEQKGLQDEGLEQNVVLLQSSMEISSRGVAHQGDVYDYIQQLIDERAAVQALRMVEQGSLDATGTSSVDFDKANFGDEIAHVYFNANTSSGQTAASLTGVSANAEGDLLIFFNALAMNGAICGACVLIFCFGRLITPMVYSFRDVDGLSDGFFGWIRGSYRLTLDEIEEAAGLDQALLMEFAHLAMKIVLILGIPMLAILSPMDWFFGGNAAGQDHLSWMGMANVQVGSWVCWVHVPAVWWTVVVIQFLIFRTMDRVFLPRRARWLMKMPRLRACTVLVENIPEGKNTNEGMVSYFDDFVFGRKVVQEVHMIRDTSSILPLVREREQLTGKLSKLKTDPNEAQTVARLRQVEEEISRFTGQAEVDESLNLTTAFVTFYQRREASICLKLLSPDDEEELEVSVAPDMPDVIWEDLVKDANASYVREFIGILLVVALFFVFLPMVVGLSAITDLDRLREWFPWIGTQVVDRFPAFVKIWEAFVTAAALSVVIGFIPTFLYYISYSFFILRAHSAVQHYLCVYGFYFNVVFVLLVTAIGSSLISVSRQLMQDPLSIFSLLASTMPTSTHFYMSYFAIQWTTHFMSLTRYVQVIKFAIYSRIYEPLEAKGYAEPEDQQYYGIGSRCARWSLLLGISVVFGTLAPIMFLLGLINFGVCRIIYGYLIVFAETRKPDLGGLFFVTQLRQVQQVEIIYVALMTGVLLQRASTFYPGIISGVAFLPLLYTYNKFKKYRWEHLEFHEVKDYDVKTHKGEIPEIAAKGTPDAGPTVYKQPELLLVAPPKEPPKGFFSNFRIDC